MAKPYITKKHCVIEILSYVCLVASIIIAIVGMAILPDEIATHFDGAGNIDGYGSPGVLLMLPLIMLFSNGVMSMVLHLMSPEAWNTPCKIEPGREVLVYRDVSSMITWMELEFGVFTLAMTIASWQQNGKLLMIETIVFMILLTIVVVYGIVACVIHSKRR